MAERKIAPATGVRYGRLIVLDPDAGRTGYGAVLVRCVCDCGVTKITNKGSLIGGRVISCGCARFGAKQHSTQAGERYGRLTVLDPDIGGRRDRKRLVRCICDCGNELIITGPGLRSGKAKSCGCLKKEGTRHRHRMSKSPEHACWKAIKSRCYNAKLPNYQDYGGRGIYVCDRWLASFENFYADMGQRPRGCSIERLDNDGPYSPDNCVWTSRKAQARNRRSSKTLKWNGETLTIAEWAERLGVDQRVIHLRLQRGWPLDLALSAPLGFQRKRS